MRFGVFQSHPIQYFSPLWAEVARRPGVALKVHYFSRQGLVAGVDRDFGQKFAWDIDLLQGYEHEFLPRRWPTTDPLDYTWKGLNEGLRQAVETGWDVVWVAGYIHLNNWMIGSACRRLGIPMMVQADSNILTAADKSGTVHWMKRMMLPRFGSMAAAFLPVSDHGKSYFEHYGIPPDKVFIVPYPTDTGRFRRTVESATPAQRAALREKYGIPHGKRIVTFSGKFVARKRPQDLVEAVSRLGREDVIAVLIGDGPLRGELEKLDRRRFVLTGFVNQGEIPLLLSLGDLNVLPSSDEPFGLAITESLCLGVPGIVSDRCGCWGPHGVVRHGESGLVYPCGDVEALASCLRELLDDEPRRLRMSARARELAEIQSPRNVATELLGVAQVLMDRAARRGTPHGLGRDLVRASARPGARDGAAASRSE